MRRTRLINLLFLWCLVNVNITIVSAEQNQKSINNDTNTLKNCEPEELITKSKGNLKNINELLGVLNDMMGEARKEKDVVKMNNITEKITSTKALLKIADQADKGAKEAINSKNGDAIKRECERISVLIEKTKIIQAESEAITGRFIFNTELGIQVEDGKDLEGKAGKKQGESTSISTDLSESQTTAPAKIDTTPVNNTFQNLTIDSKPPRASW